MPSLENWQEHFVVQRDGDLGCIPTGYEWLIRMHGIVGIDLENFQEEFNLEGTGGEENNFASIAAAVVKKYPAFNLEIKAFETGSEKIGALTELLENQTPVLASIAIPAGSLVMSLGGLHGLTEKGGFHIMPVVEITDHGIVFAHTRNQQTGDILYYSETKAEIISRHDSYLGGRDIAYLKESSE